MSQRYEFTSEIFIWNTDKAAWHFVSLPKEIAAEINHIFADEKRGWGSLPVEVTIGSSTWSTSVFPDKENDTFILPIKAVVRKQEKIGEGSKVDVEIKIKA